MRLGNSESNTTSVIPFKPLNGAIQHFQSKPFEADKVFPSEPESAYLSSYFEDSFDFPYNPDPLVPSNSYRIYDEMRHDDQVKVALSLKKDLIIGGGWQIECEVEEIKERIEFNLNYSMKDSFEDSLRDILSSFDYGFSLTEPLYQRAEDGLIEIKNLVTRPPQTFEFHLNDKGDVQMIRQNTDKGVKDFKPDYFLHHIYQPEFGNPYGQSDLRAAFQAWKTKKFFLRFWGMYVERFASPTGIAEYPPEYDSTKVAQLQSIMNTIQNSTNIVVPQGTKIDFKMPNRDSSDIYEKGISLLNTMIARAILLPDLLGVSGDKTSGGSYSLGQTQFDMFMGFIKREQENLSRRLTLKIIKPVVEANWGKEYKAEFKFKPISEEDKKEAIRIWIEAVKSKIWKPQEDEIKYAMENLNFPVSENIEIPEPAPNPFAPPNMQPNNQPPNNKKENDDEAEEKSEDDIEDETKRSFIMREKTKFEKVINFAEIERVLDKAEEKQTKRIKSFARDVYVDYLDQIKSKNLLNRFKPESINDLKIHFQKPMNQAFKAFMKDLYIESFNQAQKEFFPKMDIKFALEEELLPQQFLDIIDAESFKLVGDYSVNITKKMKDRLVQGIKNGVNERDLLSQLRELGDDETDKWLKTVIRTKSTEMFNRGRKAFWDTDEFAAQIIEAYQFSAILDDRTSEVCRYLDQKIFEKGELTTGINPPLHFNCRSVMVPITKFEDYKSDRKYVPPGREPSLESLQDKGANLALFAERNYLFSTPILRASGRVEMVADTKIIEKPGPGKRIQVYYIYATNITSTGNVIAGFRAETDEEVRYRTNLAPRGTPLTINLSKSQPWTLPEDNAFYMNLSSSVPVDYTIEYVIVDGGG